MYLNFQHLIDSFEYRGDKIYSKMYDGERFISTSYYQLYQNSLRIAVYLQKNQELHKSDKIALMSENRPEWIMAYFGIVYNGLIAVPLDAMLSMDEVKNLIKRSETTVMLVSLSIFEKLKEDQEIIGLIKEFIIFDGQKIMNSEYSNIITLDEIYHQYDYKQLIKDYVEYNDLASLIFTSGTTGKPKGVMLSHGNLMHQVNSLWKAAELTEHDVILSVLPLHHTFQFSVEMTHLGVGGQMTYAESIKPNRLIEAIKITHVTVMIGIPTLYGKILDGINRNLKQLRFPLKQIISLFYMLSYIGYKITKTHKIGESLFKSLRKKAGFNTVRFMISGAAPLSLTISEGYAILGFNLSNGYGLTEASPVISVGKPSGFIINKSLGNAIDGVSWKIIDAGDDSIGEICVKGENVMKGYYNDTDATNAIIMRDGWLKTGDMGYIRTHKGQEYLYITGRYKNIIITGGGKNIYPEEIEEILNNHPYILESIIIGVPVSESDMSEIVCALISLNIPYFEAEGINIDDPTIKDIIDAHVRQVNSKLQMYQMIRGYEIQKEELKKNSTRKIKRFIYSGKNYRYLLGHHK